MGISSKTTAGVRRLFGGASTIARWNMVCMLAIVLFGGVHVWQMSEVTQHGYAMRDLELGVEELQLETERLQTEITETMSLGAVADRMQILGFVEATNVVYLTDLDSLAVR